MHPSRRQFLKMSAASMALLAGGPAARFLIGSAEAAIINAAPGRETLFLCDSDKDLRAKNGLRVTHPGTIRMLDVESGDISDIKVPFFGHTVTQHPAHPEQVVSFEKWGRGGALFDTKDKKLLTMIEPADNKVFFGHSAFSKDGAIMVTTESNYDQTSGLLGFRTTSDMKVIQKYESFGMVPHEVRTPDEGKTLMVVNKGDDDMGVGSNISWVDWDSGKLLNKIEFGIDSNVIYGHCAVSYDNWVCVSGLTKRKHFTNLVVLINPQGEVVPPKIPADIKKRLKGEALSIAFLGQSGLVAVTVTKADLVLLIDYKTQTLVDAIPIGIPNGILPVLDGNDETPSMLVTSAKNRDLDRATVQKGQPSVVTQANAKFGGIGTHLMRLYIPA